MENRRSHRGRRVAARHRRICPGAPAPPTEGVSAVQPSEGTTMGRLIPWVWSLTLAVASVLVIPADASARGFGGGIHGGGFHPSGFHPSGFHPGGIHGFGGVPVGGFHQSGGFVGTPHWSPGLGGGLPGGTAGLRGHGG